MTSLFYRVTHFIKGTIAQLSASLSFHFYLSKSKDSLKAASGLYIVSMGGCGFLKMATGAKAKGNSTRLNTFALSCKGAATRLLNPRITRVSPVYLLKMLVIPSVMCG